MCASDGIVAQERDLSSAQVQPALLRDLPPGWGLGVPGWRQTDGRRRLSNAGRTSRPLEEDQEVASDQLNSKGPTTWMPNLPEAADLPLTCLATGVRGRDPVGLV